MAQCAFRKETGFRWTSLGSSDQPETSDRRPGNPPDENALGLKILETLKIQFLGTGDPRISKAESEECEGVETLTVRGMMLSGSYSASKYMHSHLMYQLCRIWCRYLYSYFCVLCVQTEHVLKSLSVLKSMMMLSYFLV